MPRLPKKLYYIACDNRGSKRSYDRAGGKFTSKAAFEDRKRDLDRAGASYETYEADLHWTRTGGTVVQIPGQQQLPI